MQVRFTNSHNMTFRWGPHFFQVFFFFLCSTMYKKHVSQGCYEARLHSFFFRVLIAPSEGRGSHVFLKPRDL